MDADRRQILEKRFETLMGLSDMDLRILNSRYHREGIIPYDLKMAAMNTGSSELQFLYDIFYGHLEKA